MTVKSRLLELLETHKGETISGELMAKELNCTRTAVWKAIHSLREEGYDIEAGPNRGYMLAATSNHLSVEGIRPFLAYPDVYIRVYKETVSTNQNAKEAAVSGLAGHGSFMLADCQTGGRGRMGRSFYSPEGTGLYLSVILQPSGTLEESLMLTTAAATAVYKAVRKICGIELDIKWVNDLYYRGKKVCGILTEAITDFESGNIEYAVVGIGLNICKAENGFPEEIRQVAGALFENVKEAAAVNRNRLAAEVVNVLLEEVRDLKVSPEYVEHNLVPGKKIRIMDGNSSRYAKALDISPDGRLRVEEMDGGVSLLSYGKISICPEERET